MGRILSEVTVAGRQVGLALSGGAARGLAYAGVLRVLGNEGIPVHYIAGTSAGSVAGAAYAAGLRGERLEEVALGIRWRHFSRPVWPRCGLVSFARLEAYLVKVLGDLTFADLDIPYAAVAADLETCQQVVLREGRVAPAVRASCSVPGIVAPVELGGRMLADGGIINNLPISVVRDMGADVVIAVNLVLPLGRRPEGLAEITAVALESLIARASDDPATADVCIPVPLHGLRSLLRLSGGERVIEVGRQAATKALPAIREVLG